MVNEQLLEHVKQQQGYGVPSEHVRRTLLAQGYSPENVEEVLGLVFLPTSPVVAPRHHGGKKFFLLGALVVVIAVLIAGGVYGYVTIWHSPDRIVGEMLKRMSETKAFSYSATLISPDVDSSLVKSFMGTDEPDATTLEQAQQSSITVRGFVNATNASQPQIEAVVRVESELPQLKDAPSLELRRSDTVTYINITDTKGVLDQLPFFGEQFANTWVSIDPESLAKELGLSALTQQAQDDPSDEKAQQARELIAKAHLLSVTNTLPSEKMDDVSTYHYALGVDIEAAEKLVDDLAALVGENALSARQVTNYKKTIEKFKDIEAQVWIGKKDYLLRKVVLSISSESKSEAELVHELDISVELSQFGVANNIEVPATSTSFAEILAGEKKRLEEEATTRNADDDNDGLTNSREKVYKTDPKNPDSDGDGFLDGDEVRNHFDPLGPGKVPTLHKTIDYAL